MKRLLILTMLTISISVYSKDYIDYIDNHTQDEYFVGLNSVRESFDAIHVFCGPEKKLEKADLIKSTFNAIEKIQSIIYDQVTKDIVKNNYSEKERQFVIGNMKGYFDGSTDTRLSVYIALNDELPIKSRDDLCTNSIKKLSAFFQKNE